MRWRWRDWSCFDPQMYFIGHLYALTDPEFSRKSLSAGTVEAFPIPNIDTVIIDSYERVLKSA